MPHEGRLVVEEITTTLQHGRVLFSFVSLGVSLLSSPWMLVLFNGTLTLFPSFCTKADCRLQPGPSLPVVHKADGRHLLGHPLQVVCKGVGRCQLQSLSSRSPAQGCWRLSTLVILFLSCTRLLTGIYLGCSPPVMQTSCWQATVLPHKSCLCS